MTQSAALVYLPSQLIPGAEKDALQTSIRLLAQSLNDLHLAERVTRAVGGTGYGPLRGIGVTVHEGLVILKGPVPTYYLNQLAQATALAVPGVHQVRNDLDVGRPN
jgi:osmotically-inducible protein OsmY